MIGYKKQEGTRVRLRLRVGDVVEREEVEI
jgi:hypothetical protein